MKNNKGFSLVELLVAIAIMSIIAVSSTLAFGMAKNANVNKAATTIGSVMKSVRSDCMGKDEATYLYIYMDGDEYFYSTSTSEETTLGSIMGLNKIKLCGDSISIGVKTESGDSTVGNGDFISISFEKGTGRVNYNKNGTKANLTEIDFIRGSKSAEIVVAYETGKNTIHS